MISFLFCIALISADTLTPYTSNQNGPWLQRGDAITFGNGDGNSIIELTPNNQLQEIYGIGSALTEAAASNFVALTQDQQDKLAQLYFDVENGIGTTMTRTHINSPDFAISEYIYTTDQDPNLGTFNIDRERKYVLPLVKAAFKINPNFQVFSSPWSPPGWMKDNNRMTGGGKLKRENYPVWARYMARYVTEFEKEGVPIFMLTVQNEPAATQSWESCIYSGQEEGDFAVNYLKPALREAGHPDVQVYIWDHNKGMCFERAQASYGVEGGLDNIDGLAFHWYGGDHFEDIARVHEQWPNKPMISSEICRGDIFGSDNTPYSNWDDADAYIHEIIGDFNNWANGFVDWNAFLNTTAGPYHNRDGGVKAPVIIDPAKNEFTLTPIYYAIGHFSKFVRPGARRISHILTNANLETVAFRNPDNSIVLVTLNRGNDAVNPRVVLNGRTAQISVPGHSVVTSVIREE